MFRQRTTWTADWAFFQRPQRGRSINDTPTIPKQQFDKMRALIITGAGVGLAGLCVAMLLCGSPQAQSLQRSEALNASGQRFAPSEKSSLFHDSQTINKPMPDPAGSFEENDYHLMPPSTMAASQTPREIYQANPAKNTTSPVSSKDWQTQVFAKVSSQPTETIQEPAAPSPILSADVRTIEVPIGENLPLVLSEVMAQDDFTPTEITKNAALAEEFLASAAQTDAVSQPKRWRQLVNQADELFRTWYGTDAFFAMESRRQRELVNDQSIPNP